MRLSQEWDTVLARYMTVMRENKELRQKVAALTERLQISDGASLLTNLRETLYAFQCKATLMPTPTASSGLNSLHIIRPLQRILNNVDESIELQEDVVQNALHECFKILNVFVEEVCTLSTKEPQQQQRALSFAISVIEFLIQIMHCAKFQQFHSQIDDALQRTLHSCCVQLMSRSATNEAAEIVSALMKKFSEEVTCLPHVILICAHHIAALLETMKQSSSPESGAQNGTDNENEAWYLLLSRIENASYLLRLLEICFTSEQWNALPLSLKRECAQCVVNQLWQPCVRLNECMSPPTGTSLLCAYLSSLRNIVSNVNVMS